MSGARTRVRRAARAAPPWASSRRRNARRVPGRAGQLRRRRWAGVQGAAGRERAGRSPPLRPRRSSAAAGRGSHRCDGRALRARRPPRGTRPASSRYRLPEGGGRPRAPESLRPTSPWPGLAGREAPGRRFPGRCAWSPPPGRRGSRAGRGSAPRSPRRRRAGLRCDRAPTDRRVPRPRRPGHRRARFPASTGAPSFARRCRASQVFELCFAREFHGHSLRLRHHAGSHHGCQVPSFAVGMGSDSR